MGCDGYQNEGNPRGEGFAEQEQSGNVFLPLVCSKEMFEWFGLLKRRMKSFCNNINVKSVDSGIKRLEEWGMEFRGDL